MPPVERRGRRPHTEKRVRITAYIRESTAQEVSSLLEDPLLGKVKLGSYSNLINQLLSEWLSKQKKGVPS